ncbi:MAG TPA: hypothetical protein HPP94_08705 [Desulfuromonadales bacterium]|nr:hypothetical protein [Desulfuromonadales bacterium]
MKYKATAMVTIVKEVTVEFEDDGIVTLEDQAQDAIRDSDDIPLSLYNDIEEISDLIWKLA